MVNIANFHGFSHIYLRRYKKLSCVMAQPVFPLPLSLLSLAMTKPDRQLIAQVMLYSQGFRTAEILASKIVPFFK